MEVIPCVAAHDILISSNLLASHFGDSELHTPSLAKPRSPTVPTLLQEAVPARRADRKGAAKAQIFPRSIATHIYSQ